MKQVELSDEACFPYERSSAAERMGGPPQLTLVLDAGEMLQPRSGKTFQLSPIANRSGPLP